MPGVPGGSGESVPGGSVSGGSVSGGSVSGRSVSGGSVSGNRGHGLPAIRARVSQLGGDLTVESTPGEGTVLSASIPLEPTG